MSAFHGDISPVELSATPDVDNFTSTHCVIVVLERDCDCEAQQIHHHVEACPIEKSTGEHVCVRQEWVHLELAGYCHRGDCKEGSTLR